MHVVTENKVAEASEQQMKVRGRTGALGYAFVLGTLPTHVLRVFSLQFLKAPLFHLQKLY